MSGTPARWRSEARTTIGAAGSYETRKSLTSRSSTAGWMCSGAAAAMSPKGEVSTASAVGGQEATSNAREIVDATPAAVNRTRTPCEGFATPSPRLDVPAQAAQSTASKRATPATAVATPAALSSVLLEPESAAVTASVASSTRLPPMSRTRTTGCCWNAKLERTPSGCSLSESALATPKDIRTCCCG